MTIKQNHMTSLRLPTEIHQWIKEFAMKWNTTTAYVYRSAVRDFIKSKGGKNA